MLDVVLLLYKILSIIMLSAAQRQWRTDIVSKQGENVKRKLNLEAAHKNFALISDHCNHADMRFDFH